MTLVVYAFFSLLVVVAIGDVLTTPDRGAILFELVWVVGVVLSGMWPLLAEPRRVVLSADLRFVAPARTIVIP